MTDKLLMEFRLIEVEDSAEDFEADVNYFLEESWQLNGGHQVHVIVSDDGNADPFERGIDSKVIYSQSLVRTASKPQLAVDNERGE